MVFAERRDRQPRTEKELLHYEFVEKAVRRFRWGAGYGQRHLQILDTGGQNQMIHGRFSNNRFYKLRDLSYLLKRVALFGVPVQILVTEIIDGEHLIPGTKGRFNHMAGGETGDDDPSFHSANLLPCSVGIMRIWASGYSRFNSELCVR